MSRVVLLSLLIWNINHVALSQVAVFSGGDGDGFAEGSYEQSLPLGTSLFNGGSDDGASSESYIQQAIVGANFYLGGNGDGADVNSYLQADPVGSVLFLGGGGDGFDMASYEQDLTLTFGVFTGGDGDGFDFGIYQQEDVLGADFFLGGDGDGYDAATYLQESVVGTNLFFGGFGDGYDVASYEQSTVLSATLFFGGSGDGSDVDDFEQAAPLGSLIYFGGDADGSDVDAYEQDLTLTFGVFTGGDGDGFDFDTYEQVDYIDANLPIELLSFNAVLRDGKVQLTWETATETNNSYFLIERSANLTDWISLDSIDGAGTSTALLSYQLLDNNPLLGLGYYRLKQVDFDGTSTFSLVRVVNNEVPFEDVSILVYPNPVQQKINVQLIGFVGKEYMLTLYNSEGKKVYQKSIQTVDGDGLISINRTAEMLAGYHIIVATSNGEMKKPIYRKLVFK